MAIESLKPQIDPQFFKNLKHKKFSKNFLSFLESTYHEKWSAFTHGDFDKWMSAVEAISNKGKCDVDFTKSAITISGEQKNDLKENLMKLHPWRKGPFDICGTYIDSEWRSDLKWKRVEEIGLEFKNKVILDIGCGNGYYDFKLLQYENSLVVGIEPYWLYFFQFLVVQNFVGSDRLFVFPFSLEGLKEESEGFDYVLSMGVLYHVRSPFDHFQRVLRQLKRGGTFILETLVIEGDEDQVLVPEDRYAMMRNVWFIPSVKALSKWLKRSGFTNVAVHDISFTSVEEQRESEWMGFQSLKDFLDPHDSSKTIEGYQAPLRAILTCEKA